MENNNLDCDFLIRHKSKVYKNWGVRVFLDLQQFKKDTKANEVLAVLLSIIGVLFVTT